jgi:putative flippase GtrA
VASVAFAFLTNKLWVFESKSWKSDVVGKEAGGFILARVATGVLDMVLMWLLIDVIHLSTPILSGDMLAKIIVNVIVIVLNYVASKLWIFRK